MAEFTIARGPFAPTSDAAPDLLGPPMPDPTWGEMLGASFETQNVVGSFFADEMRKADPNRIEEGFKWHEGVADHPVYGQYSDQFALLNNSAARSTLMAKIDRERENRRIIDASGVAGIVSDMAAGVIDLPSLIPGGALVRGAKGGYSVARSALMGAAAGGVGGAVAEAGLQATQATRTLEESAITIGAGIVLGGLLGGGAAALLTPVERRAAEAAATRAMDSAIDGTPLPEPAMAGEMASAGAAVANKVTREDLTVAGTAANLAGRSVAFLTPNLRLNFSPAASVRRVGQELAENATYQAMNESGESLGAAVETLAKVSMNGKMLPAVKAVDDTFIEMRKAGEKIGRVEYEEAIGRAMRRNDIGENDHISKAAQVIRAELIDPLKNEAQDVGALAKDVETTTAPSYITRLWDKNKLLAGEQRFKAIATRYFTEALGAIDDAEELAREAADAVFDNLTGRTADEVVNDLPDWIVPVTRGPLKERTFNIPDELVEDFLDNNISNIMQRYSRTMSSEIELVRRFGRADMRDQIAEISNEYRDLRMKVQAAKTADEARQIVGREPGLMDGFKDWLREKRGVEADAAGKLDITQYLAARETADLRDIKALRDMLRGTYRRGDPTWDRVSRAVSAFNYIRLMGGAVIANMQEIFRPAMVHGLEPYFREAIGPLLSKAGREAQRMSIREAQLAGQVVEAVLNERLYTIAEMGDRLAPNTAIERLLQNGVKIASRWNGINLWTDIQKSATSILSQNRIAEGIMGESDGRFLAYLGINQDLASRIKAQLAAHGEKREGIWIANTEAWDDPSGALKRAYRAAVSKDVDSVIVTRSVGDVPLFSNGPVGRLFIQFRNFFIAAHQRVLMRGLQEEPTRFISGLVAMTAAGALVSMARAWRGGEDRWEKWWQAADNPGYLIGEGLDMSGIFSVPMEVGNTIEKVTTFHPIKSPLKAAFPDASQQGSSVRYASRGGVSALLGPTAALGDLALDIRARAERAAAGLNTAEQNEALARKGVQALPFYSYPVFREGTNILLDGALPGFR